MSKVILISQAPLPFSGIGSWTTLYQNYLESNNLIDYVVCEKPSYNLTSIKYSFVENSKIVKIKKKLFKNPYIGYLEALEKIINDDQKYIIQIIDNFGIIKPLQEFLIKKNKRKNCYLQFFYHGFPPFYGNFESRYFFETINEMVLLTYDSYVEHKKHYTILPCRFSYLHNGIDTKKFFPISQSDKNLLKLNNNLQNKKIFIWCSQDRPKKGLHIVLAAWKKVHSIHKNTVLWVVGCNEKNAVDGVKYFGKIPNIDLPTYFQTSDCYLFPVLNHEGFGLSLIEALHCGNYCIASNIGGVPEVLQHGKLGKLITNPHFVKEWESAMLEFLENPIVYPSIDTNLYSSKNWNSGMNEIINNAKDYVI